MKYSEKLKDPKWQKKRLKILERDNWTCQKCLSTKKTLHVHHKHYLKCDPWEYPDKALISLCEECHVGVEKLKSRNKFIKEYSNKMKLRYKNNPKYKFSLKECLKAFSSEIVKNTEQMKGF